MDTEDITRSKNMAMGLDRLPIELLLMILERTTAHDKVCILLTSKTLRDAICTHADYVGGRLAQRHRKRLSQAIDNVDFTSNGVTFVSALRRYLDSVDVPHVSSYLSVPISAGGFAALYAPARDLPTQFVAALVHAFFNMYGMRALQKQLCSDPCIRGQPPGYIDVFPLRFIGHITKLGAWETAIRRGILMLGVTTGPHYDNLLQQVLETNPFAGKPGSISVPASYADYCYDKHSELHQMLISNASAFDVPNLPPTSRLQWYSRSGICRQYLRFAGDHGVDFPCRPAYARSLFVAAVLEDLGICSSIHNRLGGASVHQRTNW